VVHRRRLAAAAAAVAGMQKAVQCAFGNRTVGFTGENRLQAEMTVLTNQPVGTV